MLTQSSLKKISYYLHWSSLVQIMANHLFSTNNDFSRMRRFQPLAAHTIEVSAEHYNDVIMSTIASQITSLTIVYSTVFSDADQRKHQTSASLAFVREIQRDRWIPRTKVQLRGKCFHLITSSWTWIKTIVATVCGTKGYAMTSMTLYEAWSLSLFGIVPSHFWKFIQQHLMEIGKKVSYNSHFFFQDIHKGFSGYSKTHPYLTLIRWGWPIESTIFFPLQFKFDGKLISFWCNSIHGHQMATNICTCHDSCAVVACANFCSDWFIIIWESLKCDFCWLWTIN